MEIHALSFFLGGIKDADLDITVEIKTSEYYNTVMKYVIYIWKE